MPLYPAHVVTCQHIAVAMAHKERFSVLHRRALYTK